MQVVVSGTCDIYVPYGSFSLSIFKIEPEGEGSLQIAYQKLKTEFEKKGMFDQAKKNPLPSYITKIALLTGRDSAAYSDFVKILKENHFGGTIDFYPVIVQGENSEQDILDAISKLGLQDYDAVVLTRGGGSLEDLKSFNSEKIVESIYMSKIPFIVGVGHEKDETICDFVADVRASTPSQCAYYIISRNTEFFENLDLKKDYIKDCICDLVTEFKSIIETSQNLINLQVDQLLRKSFEKVDTHQRLIESYNVENILKRGFAIVQVQGKVITKVQKLKLHEKVQIAMQDGEFNALVERVTVS
jgi:exodeoxyribonuclease VII large subunit